MLLAATNLSFSYGRDGQIRAVDGVSLAVESGSVVAVLGPNGSGKTTLIKLLSGALRAGHGDITLDRISLGQLPRATVARRIAVPEELSIVGFDDTYVATLLYPPLTTIRQSIREMGQAATGLLLALIEGVEPPAAIRMPQRLVERQSAAPPRPTATGQEQHSS